MKNQVLKAFNTFVDGRGYAGEALEVTPPNIAIKTAEHRSGGMDAPIDMDVGMEKLELEYVLAKSDTDILASIGKSIRHTFKGALEDKSGNIEAVKINATGKILSAEEGAWKPGGDGIQLKVKVSLTYYKREQAGKVLHEIDVENMKRIIGGVDQLAATREAIGA